LVILGNSVMSATISGGYVRNMCLPLIRSHMSALRRVRNQVVTHIRRQPEPDKPLLRRDILQVRSRLTTDEREENAVALARAALQLREVAGARTVAAYVSMGSEPGTHA